MNAKSQQEKIILGLKIRQLREDRAYSANEMSKKAGVSLSYLNEIEKGKKYPKPQKIKLIANALDIDVQELTDGDLPSHLEPVMRLLASNFLNDLPLELFKIDLPKVVEIIANAPAQVGAFISTLVDLSQNYAMQRESFYFAALRSYLELHNNYFEELEQAVQQFIEKHELPDHTMLKSTHLAAILTQKYNYTIVEEGLNEYPELAKLRSIVLPESKKLLLNSRLNDQQRTFQFGKELGFNELGIKKRAFTSSLLRPNSFEEVLNHSKAIYFCDALLMPEKKVVKDLKYFFRQKTWQPNYLLEMMERYSASPEMLYHRLTNLLPRAFGLNDLFFIRFVHHSEEGRFRIDRELHLDERRHPHRNELSEHYCRRWIALSSLNHLTSQHAEEYSLYVQRSRYYQTEDEYVCITIARAHYPSVNKNVSVTLGIRLDEHSQKTIAFWNDPTIPIRVVNKTCERCAISDCLERVAPPIIVEKRERSKRMEKLLEELANQ